MISKNKKRITITIANQTYEALIACCKEAKINKSKYIELALNGFVNWELYTGEFKNDQSKK